MRKAIVVQRPLAVSRKARNAKFVEARITSHILTQVGRPESDAHTLANVRFKIRLHSTTEINCRDTSCGHDYGEETGATADAALLT